MTNVESPSFFGVLKERVELYFEKNKLSRTGEHRLYLKSLLQVGSAISLYVILVFNTPSSHWLSIALCILLGINFAMLGFNIMHEGGHNSFSRHSWLNVLSGYVLNVLGGNIYFWKVKHNVNHHTFTSIDGLDSDINVQPFMRLHPNQPRRVAHKYQHIYFAVLYGISYLAWIFYEDFVKYFRNRISAQAKPMSLSMREHIIFWVTKIIYVTVFVVLPILFAGWLPALIGFFIMTFFCGLFTSIVFQLAHVVELNQLPTEKKITGDWAIHQIATTSNFGTSNKFLFWILGGLNFQIEHHLFPNVSHIHYPQISRLVKETCREFNIKYNEYSSMLVAMVSHIAYLRQMGNA
jgi:linoleoyl-CoA desaturase